MGVTRLKQVAEVTMTSTAKGPGTIPYMAPEMFHKSRRGVAVDIYSLGCLYLELFTKRRVWPGLDQAEIMVKVLGAYNTPPCTPDLGDLSDMKLEICNSCLQLDPTRRATIDNILALLNKL